MITVNLLPIGAFKQRYKGRVFLVGYVLLLLMLVAGLFSYKTFFMDLSLDDLRAEEQNLQSRVMTLKRQVAEATRDTTGTARHWRQLAAIVELEERRRDQTRLLVEIDELVPKNNAWLQSLDHKNGVLTLDGISTDKETVSQFHTRLENAAYVDRQSVTLVEITQNMVINDIKLTKFKITAKTAFPQPTIINDGLPDFGLPTQEEFINVVKAVAPNLVQNIQTNATKSGKAL